MQRSGVGAGLRFGERVAADFFSAGEREEKLFLLLFCAKAMDGIAVKRVLHREDYAGRGAAAGNLLDDDAVGDVIEPGVALRFGERNPREAELGGFLERFAGEAARFIDLLGQRLYFGFGEFANGLLQ